MAAYRTGSDPIEFGDLGSKVKVTVTADVCKNDEKNSPKIHFFADIKYHRRDLDKYLPR